MNYLASETERSIQHNSRKKVVRWANLTYRRKIIPLTAKKQQLLVSGKVTHVAG
jgi:hypothetical protein